MLDFYHKKKIYMDPPYKQSTKRGKVSLKAKDIAICNAWLCITQDPVIGNSQAQSVFRKWISDNMLAPPMIQQVHHHLSKVIGGESISVVANIVGG